MEALNIDYIKQLCFKWDIYIMLRGEGGRPVKYHPTIQFQSHILLSEGGGDGALLSLDEALSGPFFM